MTAADMHKIQYEVGILMNHRRALITRWALITRRLLSLRGLFMRGCVPWFKQVTASGEVCQIRVTYTMCASLHHTLNGITPPSGCSTK